LTAANKIYATQHHIHKRWRVSLFDIVVLIYRQHIMGKAPCLLIFFFVVQGALADTGAAYVIKAKINFQGKEHVGYFKVWGYLYLTNDSLKYDIPKFTRQAKSWVYDDTISFYSEIILMKDRDLIIFPADKFIRVSKKLIKTIYPLELIVHDSMNSCYTKIKSKDKEWIFNPVQMEDKMIMLHGDDLCRYSVLYFKKLDKVSADLVRILKLEMEKGFASGKDNSSDIAPLIEQLRELKVIMLTHCSPS
jgi:hypothetical protein